MQKMLTQRAARKAAKPTLTDNFLAGQRPRLNPLPSLKKAHLKKAHLNSTQFQENIRKIRKNLVPLGSSW